MKIVLLLLFAGIEGFSGSDPGPLRGKVIEVPDGNTVMIAAEDNEIYRIILFGVDCPRPMQPFGDKARNLLEKFTMGKKVEVTVKGKDR